MSDSKRTFRKSSRSNGAGNNCVEVSVTTNDTGIRDSKLGTASPEYFVTPQAWTAFLNEAKSGKLDLA